MCYAHVHTNSEVERSSGLSRVCCKLTVVFAPPKIAPAHRHGAALSGKTSRPCSGAPGSSRQAVARWNVEYVVGEDGMGEEYELLVPPPTRSPVFLGGLSQHLSSEILLRIFQFDFLRDGHAVIADRRRTTLLLNQNGFRSWAECPPHRIGELACATQYVFPRRCYESNRHCTQRYPLCTTYALAPVKPHRHGGPLIRLPMVC